MISKIANLTKFRILKYEYLLLFTFSSSKLRKREFDWSTFFCGTNKGFTFQLKKIFVLQNSKFRQISKSPDDIYTTLKSILNVKSWMKASNFYYFSFQNIIVFNNVKFWNTLFSKMMLSFWPPLLKVNKMPRTFLWPFS